MHGSHILKGARVIDIPQSQSYAKYACEKRNDSSTLTYHKLMRSKMNKFYYFFSVIIFSSQLNASSIDLKIQYQEAQGGKNVYEAKSLSLPDSFSADSFTESCTSNVSMHKTLFAIRLSNLFKSSLSEYHAASKRCYDYAFANSEPTPVASPRIAMPRLPMPHPHWEQIRKEHALALLHNVEQLESKAASFFSADSDVLDALALAKKLSDNMMKGEFGPVFENFGGNGLGGNRPHTKMATSNMPMAARASLNVTAGGVQDYSHFKKQVQDGFVPPPTAFIEEGFLSTFTLGLEGDTCDDALICLNPAFAYDKEMRKLYVQVGMNSNVTPESFKRPPLNLSFVIDISGSMAATDNTERTRLEWAKDAVIKSLSHLNEHDTVSIVLFDSVSVVLLPTTYVTDKELIINKLQKVQTGNSTNLDAGLRDGFMLASKASKEGYETRVILFSDAGLNTGVTDHSSLLRLVSDYAGENIGLTAIGVGENFHHDFVHKITMSKGGNALFVHSGADLMKFFNNFNYLVTPVAHNFKLSSSLVDVHAKLVKAYGVPMRTDEPIQELINVRTLFLSEEGGAIVLEYDIFSLTSSQTVKSE